MQRQRELSGLSQARGRNGWFHVRRLTTWTNGDGLALEVTSTKPYVNVAPIYLELTDEDARALVGLLREMVES